MTPFRKAPSINSLAEGEAVERKLDSRFVFVRWKLSVYSSPSERGGRGLSTAPGTGPDMVGSSRTGTDEIVGGGGVPWLAGAGPGSTGTAGGGSTPGVGSVGAAVPGCAEGA